MKNIKKTILKRYYLSIYELIKEMRKIKGKNHGKYERCFKVLIDMRNELNLLRNVLN